MMRRYKQFEPLLISDFEVKEWQHPVHKHNHYELIYIKTGSGSHVINSLPLAYREGDIFLIGPEEDHYFKIAERTRFVYLKFTDAFIHQDDLNNNKSLQHLEYLIKSRETHRSGFNLSPEDRTTVDLIFSVILSFIYDQLQNQQLIWLQLFSLASILQRNMPEVQGSANRTQDIQALFCYIHKHIYTPDHLKAAVMAHHFNLAKEYVGPYFKRNTGFALRDYIRDYRNSLIRQRISSGRLSLKQIAAEFGLTDESHVSKLIKAIR